MKPPKKTDWTPEAFPQPRTFPSGWDGSALSAATGSQRHQEEARQETGSDNPVDWTPEKFPKPHTYPRNWSVDD